MPWSLLRNIEGKFLIYPETDLLSVGFVYLSSRSKPKKKPFVVFHYSKA